MNINATFVILHDYLEFAREQIFIQATKRFVKAFL